MRIFKIELGAMTGKGHWLVTFDLKSKYVPTENESFSIGTGKNAFTTLPTMVTPEKTRVVPIHTQYKVKKTALEKLRSLPEVSNIRDVK